MAPSIIELAELRALCTSGTAREIREAADVSLRELAAALDVSPAILSLWERGQRRPTGARADRYHHALTALSARRSPGYRIVRA